MKFDDFIDFELACRQLRTENQRLQFHIRSLQRELMAVKSAANEDHFSSRSELQSSAVDALKLDRHRLRAEKLELLEQVRAAYRTMEDKERELRDFIRQHEARMRDTDKDVMQVKTSIFRTQVCLIFAEFPV